jgi:hypothetical protein
MEERIDELEKKINCMEAQIKFNRVGHDIAGKRIDNLENRLQWLEDGIKVMKNTCAYNSSLEFYVYKSSFAKLEKKLEKLIYDLAVKR